MRIILLLAFVWSFSVLADSWRMPTEMASASPNAKFVVRLTPTEINSGKKSTVSIFTFDGVSYTKSIDFLLDNEWSPVFIVVTDEGDLFTFDNWGALGYGNNVVAVYSLKGELKKSYTLKELYSGDSFEKVLKNRSVSSIHWQCSDSRPWTHHGVVFVRDTIGGSFTFYKDGTFEYETKNGCSR